MKRTSIYLDPKLYRALCLKAAEIDCTITSLVNDALRMALRKDALEHEVSRKRKAVEVSYRGLLKQLKSDGIL